MTMPVAVFRVAVALAGWSLALPALAQAPSKPGEKPAPTAPAPGAKADLPVPPPNFEYSPEGRRDPFLSLAERGSDAVNPNIKRGEGAAGMTTSEMTVRGIVQTRGRWVAMVSGPDGKVYTVREGDKLADGVIRAVTATAVVILQEVNDPLSLEKQREVRKFLRGSGD
jgi:Tfp pilus assembly protein PilP